MLKPALPDAMRLLMEGAVAMARLEEVGVRIDIPYLKSAIESTKKHISELMDLQRKSDEYRLWARRFGKRMNYSSHSQLGQLVFGEMGYERNKLLRDPNDPEKVSNSVHSFAHIDLAFVKRWFEIERLKKALKTYLYGILGEAVDGRLHPFFDLHTTESYRGSSSRPNLHNFPVRNKDISRIVRTCVIPDDGFILVEADYGAQEVRVSQCYNQDPKLRDYIMGGGDMHKDMALKLYMLTAEEMGDIDTVGKLPRYCAKNQFVFPQFYGSVYVQCAPNLWDSIGRMDLKRVDGVSLYQHLKEKGIKSLGECDYSKDPKPGTFEKVVKDVQEYMWQDVFVVYDRWKKDWWRQYQRDGGVNTLTGFRMEGVFRRNQILCDPIQGSAFHCLLWSVIRIQKELIRRKMRSRLLLHIHDSMLAKVWPSELEDFVKLVKRVAVDEVARAWKWITVPLQVEFEASETNWFEKKKLKI